MRLPAEGTSEDLLADAKDNGFQASPRMITDWITKGLLAQPRRRPAGRGKGSAPAIFSGYQRQLFLEELAARQRGDGIARVAFTPIMYWVLFGDDYIPMQQAERALQTWHRAWGQATKNVAEQKAAESVRELAHPDASPHDRTTLQKLVARSMYTGRVDDSNELEQAITAVTDPHREGRLIGPPGLGYRSSDLIGFDICRDIGAFAIRRKSYTRDQLLMARAVMREQIRYILRADPFLEPFSEDRALRIYLESTDMLGVHLLAAIGKSIQEQRSAQV
jgi:hypothetical protein